ncbi:MAG: hypothetical protein GY749_43925 [Desulfobacteraceae bacterium]|nr:hypothetical protein [Desulfobacteraceae bacterium]
MTHNLLRQATSPAEPIPNKYERFNFTQNPFPAKPSVTIGSQDYRENGSIYLPELREKEQLKFEQLLIPHPDRTQVRSISFLMDYATRRGRGIGKTSFLHNQRNRIIKDFCNELSGGTEVIFAIYVSPLPDGKTRKFWQFYKLLTQELVRQDIISAAMWRLRAFSGVIPDAVLTEIESDPQNTIGDNDWLAKKNVDVIWNLDRSIQNQLQSLGIRYDLVENLTRFGHSAIDFEQKFLDNLSDYTWKNDNDQLFFSDFVKVLTTAGFTKGLILVDEVEKIITPQNTQERRTFTDSLRYFFIDGQCENARFSFYRLLLTIHPYVQELLNPHWSSTGLDRFAALSGELDSEYTIYFEPLNQESAIPLAMAYLNASRISDNQKERLEPFNSEALVEALMLSGRVPGVFLTLLNNAIEKAIQSGWEQIGVDQIRSVAKIRAPIEPKRSDIIKPLIPAQVDLRKENNLQ